MQSYETKSSDNPLNFLFNTIVLIFKNSIEIHKEKQNTKLAIQKRRIQLTLYQYSHTSTPEIRQVKTKDKTLQHICFIILLAPFFWGVIDPVGVRSYFTVVIDPLPDWYVDTILVMVGSVWGITRFRGTLFIVGKGISTAINKINAKKAAKTKYR